MLHRALVSVRAQRRVAGPGRRPAGLHPRGAQLAASRCVSLVALRGRSEGFYFSGGSNERAIQFLAVGSIERKSCLILLTACWATSGASSNSRPRGNRRPWRLPQVLGPGLCMASGLLSQHAMLTRPRGGAGTNLREHKKTQQSEAQSTICHRPRPLASVLFSQCCHAQRPAVAPHPPVESTVLCAS